jgi:hypothetical protein
MEATPRQRAFSFSRPTSHVPRPASRVPSFQRLDDFFRDDFFEDERFDEDFFDDDFFFDADFFDDDFFFDADFLRAGTFAPFFRASDSPIAIACLRLFTLPPLPPRPLLSEPDFRFFIARFTDLPAAFP